MVDLIAIGDGLHVPGRLTADGTDLGEVSRLEMRFVQARRDIPEEGRGNETKEVIIGSESPELAVVFRGMPDKAVAEVFAGAGASYGVGDDSRLGSASSFELKFIPENGTDHPTLTIFKAIALHDDTAPLVFMLGEEAGFGAIFVSISSGSGSYSIA